MHHQFMELELKALEGYEAPSITSLHAQEDGSLLCGLAFAKPLLLKLIPNDNGTKFADMVSMNVESMLGEGAVAVLGGLRAKTTGDTIFTVLAEGFLPGFMRKLKNLKGEELIQFLHKNSGGVGGTVRHSIVEIHGSDSKMELRYVKDSGVLLDVMHMGSTVYGLSGKSIWKEPALNPEKREILRSDLVGNHALHRDADGNFWMSSKNARLMRLSHVDIKPKATTIALPGVKEGKDFAFYQSTASHVDGWLYGVGGNRKTLFRLRRNPESYVEEIQKLREFPSNITCIFALEREKNSKLLIALEGEADSGAVLWSIPLKEAEDPEEIPPIPGFTMEGVLKGMNHLGTLTLDNKGRLWGGEFSLGRGTANGSMPKIVRIASV